MIKRQYAIKHINNSGDYKAAYDIAHTIEYGQPLEYDCHNVKVFRKYLYEVGAKINKSFASRKSGNTITVTLL